VNRHHRSVVVDHPPPVFFLLLFPMLAVSAGIVIRSIGSAVAKVRASRVPPQLPPPPAAGPDARVAQLQAELDELRTQVERLHAAESFYAQLQAPAQPATAARDGTRA
jgi:hypothetical protein